MHIGGRQECSRHATAATYATQAHALYGVCAASGFDANHLRPFVCHFGKDKNMYDVVLCVNVSLRQSRKGSANRMSMIICPARLNSVHQFGLKIHYYLYCISPRYYSKCRINETLKTANDNAGLVCVYWHTPYIRVCVRACVRVCVFAICDIVPTGLDWGRDGYHGFHTSLVLGVGRRG